MKVAVIGPAPPHRGGIAAHTAGLIDAFATAGVETDLIGFERLYPDFIFPGRSQFNAEAVETPVCRLSLDPLRPGTWRAVNAYLRRTQPDAVAVQWWHPAFAPALTTATANLAPTKVVFVCHNHTPHESLPGSAALTRRALSRADALLCHSDYTAGEILALFRDQGRDCVPIHSVPIPVSIAPRADTTPGARLRDSYKVPQNAALVFTPGLVRGYKGIDVLLRAWGELTTHTDARLLIAGESYLGPGRLATMVRHSKRPESLIVDERYLSDQELLSLIAAADLMVLPHTRASQSGLVPIALALGTPLLTSDAGGLRENLPGEAVRRRFRAGSARSLRQELQSALAAGPKQPLLRNATRQPGQFKAGYDQEQHKRTYREGWREVVEAFGLLMRRLDKRAEDQGRVLRRGSGPVV